MNYRHLHYFWMVAKEGGFTRAAERTGMAVQTVSAQVRALEQALGCQLLKPEGRGVVLTEAGAVAFARAEQIFQIGQGLPEAVQAAAEGRAVRLAVGFCDGISKLAAHRLLEPLLATPDLRLLCHEGETDQLLAELALHQLDVVLAGQPAPRHPSLRLQSVRLAASQVQWFGAERLVGRTGTTPLAQGLARWPVLLPTHHSPLRGALDHWFEEQGIHPHIVGEFEDSALLMVFGAEGLGVFPMAQMGMALPRRLGGLRLLGECAGVHEEIHAIRMRRGLHHPLVDRLVAGGGYESQTPVG